MEIAKITTLRSAVPPHTTTTLVDAHVAYGSHSQCSATPSHHPLKYVTQAIHTTKDSRRLLSTTRQPPRCKLGNNGHPNPWHTEANCPFKDPTHILCKTTRENVMQHNSLHGAINKHFSKHQVKTVPSTPRPPPTPTTPTGRTTTPTVCFATGTSPTTPPTPEPVFV